MRTILMALLLGAALLAPAGTAGAATPATAPAPMLASSLGLPGGGPVLAFRRSRGGGSFGRRTSPSYRYPRTYRPGYRTRRRGGGFFRGLFTGWLLSHFLGGYGFGLPIFPILLVGVVLWLTSRRRRRRPSYGW